MTAAQRFEFLIDGCRKNPGHVSLWTKACRAQVWPRNDREFRIQKVSEALGREVASTSELNNTDDVTRLFTFLRAKADNLNAAVAMEEPGFERKPQLLYNIRETEAELAAYPVDGPMGPEGVRRLVRSLCADIANKGRSVRVEIKDVEDLSAAPIEFTRGGKRRKIRSQLDQLLVTLNRMLGKYKAEEREWVDDEKRAQNEPDAPVDDSVPF